VDWLRRTYGLPASVIPPFWHRHPELVWELSALHLHWLCAYDPEQNGSAPLGWHRDFADARAALRDWVAACGTRLDRDRPEKTRQTVWPGEDPASPRPSRTPDHRPTATRTSCSSSSAWRQRAQAAREDAFFPQPRRRRDHPPRLKEAGVMLVSATENIDETPSGMLLHGIMSTIAEFYSRNLATEVVKGMNQKARRAARTARHPSATSTSASATSSGARYAPSRSTPNVPPLVEWAFEAYATGNWTTSQLHEELIDRGLTTVPTPKRPAKPPALSTIQRMLTNPYYKGSPLPRHPYDGNHEPLVATEVWYRVQAVLTAHQTSGEKTQAHDHYLKGSVYCGQCGSRLIVTNAKSRRGVIYPYFICSGRHSKRTDCERKSMFVPTSKPPSRTTTAASRSPRTSSPRCGTHHQ
jgi:hypothetical protein